MHFLGNRKYWGDSIHLDKVKEDVDAYLSLHREPDFAVLAGFVACFFCCLFALIQLLVI